MLDTKGPEIRTGMLVGGEAIHLVKDQLLEITTDYEVRNHPPPCLCNVHMDYARAFLSSRLAHCRRTCTAPRRPVQDRLLLQVPAHVREARAGDPGR